MADSSMRDYGLAAPHGPNRTGQHVATASVGDMSDNEASVFRSLLLPDDSYDEQGTYWADMPLGRRIAFVNKVNNAEAKKELTTIGRMIKADPLSPIAFYFRNMVIPGMGLLLEGYVLFSIGNVKPLLAASFPACWDSKNGGEACNQTWIAALDYLEIVGIIVGQILVGILGDWLGRRWGLIQDAVIMFVGLLMLTACWGVTLNGWVICYVWSLWFYGVGVGGEYPMTATSGMENAVGSGKVSTRDDRLHRGRKVTSAFLMQGWGQWWNQVVLIVLLLIFNSGSSPPYSKVTTQWTFRLSFAIPAAGTLWLCYYRTYKMRSASRQLQAAKKKSSVTGYDVQSLKLTIRYFGPRLLATAIGWYANDVFFYGNKLFQSDFIEALNPNTKSVMVNWLWNLVNIGVELCGYYLASFVIDHKLYGRKWMQIIGFMGCFFCFVIPAFRYHYYADPGGATNSFMAMYYISSFFGQFGPNAVTFLVAAEVFPTPVRASAHGFSAACGKLGALTAAVLFGYIGTPTRFLVVPWFGLAGALITYLFLPDTTGLDLKEQERRWAFIRAGREHEYHGIAIHPKHLSVWERLRGVGKYYDAEADYQQRVEEMRADWEAAMARRIEEKEAAAEAFDDDDWSSEVSQFFQRTKSPSEGNGNGSGNGVMSPFKRQQYAGNGISESEEEKDRKVQ